MLLLFLRCPMHGVARIDGDARLLAMPAAVSQLTDSGVAPLDLDGEGDAGGNGGREGGCGLLASELSSSCDASVRTPVTPSGELVPIISFDKVGTRDSVSRASLPDRERECCWCELSAARVLIGAGDDMGECMVDPDIDFADV